MRQRGYACSALRLLLPLAVQSESAAFPQKRIFRPSSNDVSFTSAPRGPKRTVAYTWKLTLAAIGNLLAGTAEARDAFDGRAVAEQEDIALVGNIYGEFRAVLRPVGAA